MTSKVANGSAPARESFGAGNLPAVDRPDRREGQSKSDAAQAPAGAHRAECRNPISGSLGRLDLEAKPGKGIGGLLAQIPEGLDPGAPLEDGQPAHPGVVLDHNIGVVGVGKGVKVAFPKADVPDLDPPPECDQSARIVTTTPCIHDLVPGLGESLCIAAVDFASEPSPSIHDPDGYRIGSIEKG